MYKKISFAIATCLGTGYAPAASGTAGSLFTVLIAAVVAYHWSWVGILAMAVLGMIAGVLATTEVLKYTAHDPKIIVIDEFTGQSLSFVLVAPYLVGTMQNWWIYVVGFALFRLFDICKMGPVKWADEKLLNAWGVMLDDVFAGAIAAILLYVIVYLVK